MIVSKWGNSMAVRLPTAVVQKLGLKEGDEIEIQVGEDKVFNVYKKLSRKEALDRLFELADRKPAVPADYKFNRDEANER
jgi:antitoxin MazE